MWGAEDLVASLGGTSSRKPNGRYRDVARYARSRTLLAAGAHGKAAIDAVQLDISDVKRLRIEATDAAATGFSATACIHPSQVEVIRAAYRPDAASLAWARGVLAAAKSERGVFSYEGRMVDEPVLRHARSCCSARGPDRRLTRPGGSARALRDDLGGDACDERVRQRLRVGEDDGVLLGAIGRDLRLERRRTAQAPGTARCASSSRRSAARSDRRA